MMNLKELFLQQKKLMMAFFDHLDVKKAQSIVDVILACQGTLFLSGVGKSGIIAEKLAMTMISTGTKAMYLPASNALHGDIGIVSSKDLFIMLSKSGESQELIDLIPYLKQRGVSTMAWVSKIPSTLARQCDFFVELFVERELCPFNLAPTTSTAAQLIFGDVVAVALMKKRNFSFQDYAKNHPAGDIGKKTLKVQDVMLQGSKIPTCSVKDKLKDCLVELTNKKCGCLIVVDDKQQVRGIFTDGDLRRALQNKSIKILEEMMENIMTKEFVSIRQDCYVHEALRLMQKDLKKMIMMLPVTDNNKLVGLVHMHDAVQFNL